MNDQFRLIGYYFLPSLSTSKDNDDLIIVKENGNCM